MEREPTDLTLKHAHSMEVISVTDSVPNQAELNALLKKINYDPYNEDEASIYLIL